MKLDLFFSRQAARLSTSISRHRAPLQFTLGVIATSLGLWGWWLKETPHDWSGYANNFFRTLQLITLHFPTEFGGQIPWQLQIARLLVPLVAVLATFNVLIGSITRPLRLALLPRSRDHIILVGDAKMAEEALRALAERGQRIIVISASLGATRRETLEGYGLTVVEEDPRQLTTFEGLNLGKARGVFLTEPDDLENLNLAMMVVQATRNRASDTPPLVLAVLIDREDLASELDSALDGVTRRHHVRYHRLCPDREGLWLGLARYAPIFEKRDRDSPSHVLIFGLGGRWKQIVADILVSTQDCPNERPLLSFVVNASEAEQLARWRAGRPDLELVARFEILMAGQRMLPCDEDAAVWRAHCGPPHLAIVLLEDADAIAAALSLRGSLGAERAPILVRQSKEDRLLKALDETPVWGRDLTRMVAFGGLIRSKTIERIMDRAGEEVAIAVHAHYLEAVKDLPPSSPAAVAAWDALSENLRAANRAAADHAPVLFASAGLRIELASSATKATELSSDEIERLARVEHRRWMADRIDRGWRGGETRDDERRIHPSFKDFDALTASEQEKDRAAVRALVKALHMAGRIVTRMEVC